MKKKIVRLFNKSFYGALEYRHIYFSIFERKNNVFER